MYQSKRGLSYNAAIALNRKAGLRRIREIQEEKARPKQEAFEKEQEERRLAEKSRALKQVQDHILGKHQLLKEANERRMNGGLGYLGLEEGLQQLLQQQEEQQLSNSQEAWEAWLQEVERPLPVAPEPQETPEDQLRVLMETLGELFPLVIQAAEIDLNRPVSDNLINEIIEAAEIEGAL